MAFYFTIIPIAIGLLFAISRSINVDDHEPVKQKQGQKLLQNKDAQRRGNIEAIKGKRKNRRITRYPEPAIRNDGSRTIDVKGAITLAIAITSFLLLLTFLQTGTSSSGSRDSSNFNNTTIGSDSNSAILAICFLVSGIVSLALFIVIEKRSTSPLVDFSLISNMRMLPANIIIMIVGFSMFMVFQTMPIFMENPLPVGFGEDAINATKVILPFALVLLVFGPASGLIISKLGSMKPLIIGTIVISIALFSLVSFQSTKLLISINLGILSVGLSLANVGAQNVIMLSMPRQNSGISLGLTTLLRIVNVYARTSVYHQHSRKSAVFPVV